MHSPQGIQLFSPSPTDRKITGVTQNLRLFTLDPIIGTDLVIKKHLKHQHS